MLTKIQIIVNDIWNKIDEMKYLKSEDVKELKELLLMIKEEKWKMDKLTPEQEDYISDGAYHEKKLREEEEKRGYKKIPINPEAFSQILIRIGRKKQEVKKWKNH